MVPSLNGSCDAGQCFVTASKCSTVSPYGLTISTHAGAESDPAASSPSPASIAAGCGLLPNPDCAQVRKNELAHPTFWPTGSSISHHSVPLYMAAAVVVRYM